MPPRGKFPRAAPQSRDSDVTNIGAQTSPTDYLNQNQPPPPLSPEALSLAHLRQKSISHPMNQIQIIIYVPKQTVGAVIGRGGKTILR